MSQLLLKWIIWMVLALQFIGCATTDSAKINKKEDYVTARGFLESGEVQKSLSSLPKKEKSFLEVFEYNWIALLSDRSPADDAQQWAQRLEYAKIIRLSEETSKFFYKDIGTSYFPSEPEVVMYHIVLALHHLKANELGLARVEAKRAARYLQTDQIDYAGQFDSVFLRLLLSQVWLGLGEWQHARVDFARIAVMDSRYAYLADFAKKKLPPKNLSVVLRGIGPEVFWMPDDENAKDFGLVFRDKELARGADMKNFYASFGGPVVNADWYERHFDRESSTRQFLDRSRHVVDVTLGVVAATVLTAAAIAASVVIVAGAIAVSVALTKEMNSFDSLEISKYLIVGAMGLAKGITEKGGEQATSTYNAAADESVAFRFARFIPSQAYFTLDQSDQFERYKYFRTRIKELLNIETQTTTVGLYWSPN